MLYEHMWERKYTCHKRNVKFYFYVLYCAFYKFFFSHLYMRACLWMCFWMCACMPVVKRVGTLWKCKTTHFWICTVTACVWLMIDARSCSCLTSMMKPLVTFTFVFQNDKMPLIYNLFFSILFQLFIKFHSFSRNSI